MDSTTLTKFRQFTRLPLEIQSMIIKRALPKPVIVDLCASMLTEGINGGRMMSISTPRYPELLPLLMACRVSNSEVYHSYQKIEMVIPSIFKIIHHDYFHQHAYAYIRPSIDTLLLQAHSLISIYQEGGHLSLGGHLDLSRITSLALDNAIIKDVHNIPVNDEAMMCKQAELYTLLSVHFPALKKLFLLIEAQCGGGARYSVPPDKRDLRIMDISDGMMDLDLHYAVHDGVFESENNPWFRGKVTTIHQDTIRVLGDFERFLNTKKDDPWAAPGEETLRYWKNLRPTPGLLCLFDTSVDGMVFRSKDIYPPRLYLLELNADISCHLDATPIHKYKGLSQIFDGAPW